MTDCMECGKPTYLSYEEALSLNCKGIHFFERDGTIYPVGSKGLEIGSHSIIIDIRHGVGVQIGSFCDLYRCVIGNFTKIKRYVEIQEYVKIGEFCKIESFVFIPSHVTIGNRVFIGPGVKFTNDLYPKATGNWQPLITIVEDEVSIGANSTIRAGVRLGEGCMIGMGSNVTKDVAPGAVVAGNPARPIKRKGDAE